MSVWLNSQEYKGAKALKLSLDSEVQKHPIEKGYPVADHIKHNAPSFEVTLTLGGTITGKDRNTEYARLKDLRDKGVPFLLVISDFGSFDSMVISSLSPALENSNNTYSCSLTVTQVRVAELKTEYFTINDKDGKEIYSPVKPTGTPPTQALQTKSIANEPVKSGLLTWGAVLLSYFKGA